MKNKNKSGTPKNKSSGNCDKNTNRYLRAEEIFDSARHLEGREREIYLAAACREDLEQRRLVEDLIERHQHPYILHDHTFDRRGEVTGRSELSPGQLVGGYRIVRRIGEGGMALVYEAEQEHPRRRVALKIIKLHKISEHTQKRFESEAEILAQLHHPNIEQIYESGVMETLAGTRPFFAMELIEGDALHDYVRFHGLNTQQRLEIIATLCDAVQYAHDHGVIHRDLKPDNVLVDGAGRLKVLDFGVARATDSDVQLSTMHTEMGQLLGTLAYMSPEQASGDPSKIDERSDVYSIGVILYEILTGQLPYDLSHKMIPDAVRIIRETDPTRLSSINRNYHGDVETIIRKALDKDRNHRYQTVREIAEDIHRYLTDRPIVARPDSTFYKLRKFSRRNRTIVISTTTVLFALSVGLVVAIAFAQRAVNETKRQEMVSTFVLDVLGSSEANVQGRDVSLVEVVDRMEGGLTEQFAGQPDLEAKIRLCLGGTYLRHGLLEKAELNTQKIIDLARGHASARQHEVPAIHLLANVRWEEARFEEAETLYRTALDLAHARPRTPARVMVNILNDYAYHLSTAGRVTEARPFIEQAWEICQRTLDPSEIAVAECRHNLAVLAYSEGRAAEAVDLQRAVVGQFRVLFKDDDNRMIRAKADLSVFLMGDGAMKEAEEVLRDTLDQQTRTYGEVDTLTLHLRTNLALLIGKQGRLDESLKELRSIYMSQKSTLGADHEMTLQTASSIGRTLILVGRVEEAGEILEGAMVQLEESTETLPYLVSYLQETYGLYLKATDKSDEAEERLSTAYQLSFENNGPNQHHTRAIARCLAALYEEQGRRDEAETYRNLAGEMPELH